MQSYTEENYLKAIYKLEEKGSEKIYTNDLASAFAISPASVTDMVRKLSEKKLVHYEPYMGVSLTTVGKKIALNIIRRHRLWELFLVDKLDFKWHQVHDVAEELEHINSDTLIERLDHFLGYPSIDPHGDPIPDSKGNIKKVKSISLSEMTERGKAIVTGVIDHSAKFLMHIEDIGLAIGHEIKLNKKYDYDGSCFIKVKNKSNEIQLSHSVAKNILVKTTL